MDRAQKQRTRFRVPSSTHSPSCALQEFVCPLIRTVLTLSRPSGTQFRESSFTRYSAGTNKMLTGVGTLSTCPDGFSWPLF
jgi:hypothetical protein